MRADLKTSILELDFCDTFRYSYEFLTSDKKITFRLQLIATLDTYIHMYVCDLEGGRMVKMSE
jgi:hypothetical protein